MGGKDTTVSRTTSRLLWLVLVSASLLLSACTRQTGVPAASAGTSGDESQNAPFGPSSQGNGASAVPSLLPSLPSLPPGTTLTVRLQASLSSATAQAGERFEGELDQPIVVDGQTVVEKGASVWGRVVAAKASGGLHDPGYLRLSLTSINVNNRDVPLQTSSVFAKGASHEKRNLAIIGGSAGGGALIGGLAGGGKGALIGSLIGTAGGTGAAYATGKKDVVFGTERRLTFRLTEPASLGS